MPNKVIRTLTPHGVHILPEQRERVIELLESGRYPSLSQIARVAMVSPTSIRRMFEKDPELKERWHSALMMQADELAQTAVEFCKDEGINPIAREKMIEYMLPKLDRERFGESTELSDALKNSSRRIVIAPILPVANVDANGIPVAEQRGDPIEVSGTSSPSPLKNEGT